MVSSKAKHRNEEKVWQIIRGKSGITEWHNVQDRASEIPYSLFMSCLSIQVGPYKKSIICSYSKEVTPLLCRVFCSRDNYMLLILNFDHKTMFTWPVLRWIIT